MQNLIDTVGLLVNALFGANGWVSKVVGTITASGNEILLVGFIVSLACLAVGVVKRLSRLGYSILFTVLQLSLPLAGEAGGPLIIWRYPMRNFFNNFLYSFSRFYRLYLKYRYVRVIVWTVIWLWAVSAYSRSPVLFLVRVILILLYRSHFIFPVKLAI